MNKKSMVAVAKSTGLLVMGLALAMSAGCGGSPKLESTKDFQFLPDNPVVIGSFRIEEIVSSQAYKDLMAEVKKMGKDDPMKEMEQGIGLTPDDIARVTFATGDDGKDTVTIVTTKKPVTASELTAKMKKRHFSDKGPELVARKFKEVPVGSYAMQEEEDDFNKSAFCVVDKNTVVLSESKTLKPILERNKNVELSADMKKALELADQSKPVFVAINAKAGQKMKEGLPPQAAAAGKAEAIAISADISSDAKINVTALFPDAAGAEAAKAQANDGIKLATGAIVLLPAEMKTLKDELNKTIESIKIEASGNKLAATAAVKPATLMSMVASLGQKSEVRFEKVGTTLPPEAVPPVKEE